MSYPSIYFDESGNTGPDLLNQQDPVFVLASCQFPMDLEHQLRQHFSSYRGSELKFTKLRTSARGRRAVLSFLNDELVCSETVGAFLMHKRHMIVTKYCDMVVEPSMRKFGFNFYENGLNIAMSNLLTIVMPTYLNPKTWDSFLSGFVRMVRDKSPDSLSNFKTTAKLAYDYISSTDEMLATILKCAIDLRKDEFLPLIGQTELDPIVPAFYGLANIWGKKIGGLFQVCTDESKTMALERDRLMALANPELPEITQGFDRRKMTFPLKVAGVIAVDSKTQLQVQFADVIAGSIAAGLRPGTNPNSFEAECAKTCLSKGFVVDGIWPSTDITPEELGTEQAPQEGEVDLPTFTASIVKNDPAWKKYFG